MLGRRGNFSLGVVNTSGTWRTRAIGGTLSKGTTKCQTCILTAWKPGVYHGSFRVEFWTCILTAWRPGVYHGPFKIEFRARI